MVSTDDQDGNSYAFSLNLNFNIINDNPQDTYNPEAINSLFSMNLFNQAMAPLYRDWETDRKSTRLNSSHSAKSRMPSSA